MTKNPRKARKDRLAARPAKPSERIKGSSRNRIGSAASRSNDISLSISTDRTIQAKVREHNAKMKQAGKPSWSMASASVLKSVYRRGAGAFSVSHRPGMTRGQWAIARVNAFLILLETGKPKNPRYTTDNDLLPKGHPRRSGVKSAEMVSRLPRGSKPSEVRVRRFVRGQRGIAGIDTLPGGGLVSAPVVASKSEYEFVGEFERCEWVPFEVGNDGEVKRYNYFSRDGDFDGLVQDGTPWMRRSRSLAHRRFGRNFKPRKRQTRLRDLPFEVFATADPSEITKKKVDSFFGLSFCDQAIVRADRWAQEGRMVLKTAESNLIYEKSLGKLVGQIGKPLTKFKRRDLKKIKAYETPGARDALARGALIDENGYFRCPPGTPGAMQFTNHKLTGCQKFSPSKFKLDGSAERLIARDFADFEQNYGDRIVNEASIQAGLASAASGAQNPFFEGRAVIARRRVVASLTGQRGKKRTSTAGRVTPLQRMVEAAALEKSHLVIDLDDGKEITSGYLIPRSDMGVDIPLSQLTNPDGTINPDALTVLAAYVDQNIEGFQVAEGAESATLMVSRRTQRYNAEKGKWEPIFEYVPEAVPFTGRAQQLADEADGDYGRLKELINEEGYVVFDFETTGLDQWGDVPIQLSAIRYKDGKEVGRMNVFLNPDGQPISPWSAQNVKRKDGKPLTDAWLAKQKSQKEALQEFVDFVGDSMVGAYNIRYDREQVLLPALERHGIDFSPSGTFDVMTMAKQLVPKVKNDDDDGVKSHALGSVSAWFGKPLDKAHAADADSEAAHHVLQNVLDYAKRTDASPDVLDGAKQAERRQKALEKYELDRQVNNERAVLNVAFADVFPSDGEKPEDVRARRKEALDAGKKLGSDFVLDISKGTVIDERPAKVVGGVDPVDFRLPRGRKIGEVNNELDRAMASVASEDNMKLSGFSEKNLQGMLTNMKKIPGFEWIDDKDPAFLALVTDQLANNYVGLLQRVSEKRRNVTRHWYRGANNFASDLADDNNLSVAGVAAVIATLSPQKDWDMNITMADHLIRYLSQEGDQPMDRATAQQVRRAMQSYIALQRRNLPDKIDEAVKKRDSALAKLRKAEESKNANRAIISEQLYALNELEAEVRELEEAYKLYRTMQVPSMQQLTSKSLLEQDDFIVGYVTRWHLENRAGKMYGQDQNALMTFKMELLPDGNYRLNTSGKFADDSKTGKVAAQSGTAYRKAVAAFRLSQQNENIDYAKLEGTLGGYPKVRSFFNNILNPDDVRWKDATSDTHNFGAGTGLPAPSNTRAIKTMFGNSGNSTYPVFWSGLVLAADRWNRENDDDLLPREVQSIVWEAIRELVPTEYPSLTEPGKIVKSDTGLKGIMLDTLAQLQFEIHDPTNKRRMTPVQYWDAVEDLSTKLRMVPPRSREREKILADWRRDMNLKDENAIHVEMDNEFSIDDVTWDPEKNVFVRVRDSDDKVIEMDPAQVLRSRKKLESLELDKERDAFYVKGSERLRPDGSIESAKWIPKYLAPREPKKVKPRRAGIRIMSDGGDFDAPNEWDNLANAVTEMSDDDFTKALYAAWFSGATDLDGRRVNILDRIAYNTNKIKDIAYEQNEGELTSVNAAIINAADALDDLLAGDFAGETLDDIKNKNIGLLEGLFKLLNLEQYDGDGPSFAKMYAEIDDTSKDILKEILFLTEKQPVYTRPAYHARELLAAIAKGDEENIKNNIYTLLDMFDDIDVSQENRSNLRVLRALNSQSVLEYEYSRQGSLEFLRETGAGMRSPQASTAQPSVADRPKFIPDASFVADVAGRLRSSGRYFEQVAMPDTFSGYKAHVYAETPEQVAAILQAVRSKLRLNDTDGTWGAKLATQVFFDRTNNGHPQKGKAVTVYFPDRETWQDDLAELVSIVDTIDLPEGRIQNDNDAGRNVGWRFEFSSDPGRNVTLDEYKDLYTAAYNSDDNGLEDEIASADIQVTVPRPIDVTERMINAIGIDGLLAPGTKRIRESEYFPIPDDIAQKTVQERIDWLVANEPKTLAYLGDLEDKKLYDAWIRTVGREVASLIEAPLVDSGEFDDIEDRFDEFFNPPVISDLDKRRAVRDALKRAGVDIKNIAPASVKEAFDIEFESSYSAAGIRLFSGTRSIKKSKIQVQAGATEEELIARAISVFPVPLIRSLGVRRNGKRLGFVFTTKKESGDGSLYDPVNHQVIIALHPDAYSQKTNKTGNQDLWQRHIESHLIHEIGHAIDFIKLSEWEDKHGAPDPNNPQNPFGDVPADFYQNIRRVMQSFMELRTQDQPVVKLKDVLPSRNYTDNMIALPDDLDYFYAGRIYPWSPLNPRPTRPEGTLAVGKPYEFGAFLEAFPMGLEILNGNRSFFGDVDLVNAILGILLLNGRTQ